MAIKPIFSWTRFWREIPDRDKQHRANSPPQTSPDLACQLSDLDDRQLVVLIGEPGMGKSTAVQQAVAATCNALGEDYVHYVKLGQFSAGMGSHLILVVFEDPKVKAWIPESHVLYLYLDGFDECHDQLPGLEGLIVGELARRKWPLNRLRLRIVCRSARWRQLEQFESDLRELFVRTSSASIPPPKVGTFELQPLSLIEIGLAADSSSVDSASFIRALTERDLMSLAQSPLTLEMLLAHFKFDGSLPDSRWDLFESGCKALVAEHRQTSRSVGLLAPEQRLQMAGRLACVSILSARPVFDVAISTADSAAIRVSQLSGGTEIGPRTNEVLEEHLAEVLETALFTSLSSTTYTWAHKSFSDFLAAWYLRKWEVSAAGVTRLATRNGTRDVADLIPQLEELAIWLATVDPQLSAWIVASRPELLLRNEVALSKADQRETLLNALIVKSQNTTQLITLDDYRGMLHRVNCPGAVPRLREIVSNWNAPEQALLLAIFAAEECRISELCIELLPIANRGTLPSHVRSAAISVIGQLGTPKQVVELKPLLDELNTDTDDSLRGHLLEALWPEHMSFDDVVRYIKDPKQPNLFGQYRMFLWEFATKLPERYFVAALGWVARQASSHQQDHDFEHDDVSETIAPGIFARIWDRLSGSEEILAAYSQAIAARLRCRLPVLADADRMRGKDDFTVLLAKSHSQRRRLAVSLLSILATEPDDAPYLGWSFGLVTKNDIGWGLELLTGNNITDSREQVIFVRWIVQAADWHDPDQVAACFDALESSFIGPKARTELGRYFDPIDLDSKDAEDLRFMWRMNHKDNSKSRDEEARAKVALQWSYRQIELTSPENVDVFWRGYQVAVSFSHKDNSISNSALWREADDQQRSVIVDRSGLFIALGDPRNADWLRQNIDHFPAEAGYAALQLIAREAPRQLSEIPISVWNKWMISILLCGRDVSEDDRGIRGRLLSYAIQSDSGAMHRAIVEAYLHIGAAYARVWLPRLDSIWSVDLGLELRAVLENRNLADDKYECLLEALLRHHDSSTMDMVNRILDQPLDADNRNALVAASYLETLPSEAWTRVWTKIENEPGSAEAVLSRAIGHRSTHSQLCSRLSESQLQRSFTWLIARYPNENDPDHNGVFTPTFRDNIAWFRDWCLQALVSRGTDRACDSIAELATEFPDKLWLRESLRQARMNSLRNAWQPLQPRVVLRCINTTVDEAVVDEEAQAVAAVLFDYFDLAGLEILAEDMALRWENIQGSSISEKSRSLAKRCWRDDSLDSLKANIVRSRPSVSGLTARLRLVGLPNSSSDQLV